MAVDKNYSSEMFDDKRKLTWNEFSGRQPICLHK